MADAQLLAQVRPLLRPSESALAAIAGSLPSTPDAEKHELEAGSDELGDERRHVLVLVASTDAPGEEARCVAPGSVGGVQRS